VDYARRLLEATPDDRATRDCYLIAISFRGAARALARDIAGALDDYAAAQREPMTGQSDVLNWTRVGEAAYLHLVGRDDQALARIRDLDGIRAGLAAEWRYQLDTVAAVVLASTTGDAPVIRRQAAQRIESVRGLATHNFVHSKLSELGILAALAAEPERAVVLLRHSGGPAFVHSGQLHWEYAARLEGWPDTEFDDRRRDHLIAVRRPDALAVATALLDEELTRLLSDGATTSALA